jgi:hypothetical protein
MGIASEISNLLVQLDEKSPNREMYKPIATWLYGRKLRWSLLFNDVLDREMIDSVASWIEDAASTGNSSNVLCADSGVTRKQRTTWREVLIEFTPNTGRGKPRILLKALCRNTNKPFAHVAEVYDDKSIGVVDLELVDEPGGWKQKTEGTGGRFSATYEGKVRWWERLACPRCNDPDRLLCDNCRFWICIGKAPIGKCPNCRSTFRSPERREDGHVLCEIANAFPTQGGTSGTQGHSIDAVTNLVSIDSRMLIK